MRIEIRRKKIYQDEKQMDARALERTIFPFVPSLNLGEAKALGLKLRNLIYKPQIRTFWQVSMFSAKRLFSKVPCNIY